MMGEFIRQLNEMVGVISDKLDEIIAQLITLEVKAESQAPMPCRIEMGSGFPAGTSQWNLVIEGNNPDELHAILLDLISHSRVIKGM